MPMITAGILAATAVAGMGYQIASGVDQANKASALRKREGTLNAISEQEQDIAARKKDMQERAAEMQRARDAQIATKDMTSQGPKGDVPAATPLGQIGKKMSGRKTLLGG